AAEIEDFELTATPCAQPADALERVDVVVEGWADKCSDVDVGLAGRLPVIEPVNEPLEARERQLAALPRFRDQAIAADVGARGVAQREYQPAGENFSRHL